MTTYILRRLLQGLIVLILVTLFIFFTMRLLPGDPLVIYMAQQAQQLQEMPPEVLDKLRHEFGLDKPMIVQYAIWISDLFKGDFGTSVFYRQSVGMLMLERFPVTTYLAVLSIILSAMVGIISGLIAAIRRGRLIDNVVTPLTYIGITIPIFWLGISFPVFSGLEPYRRPGVIMTAGCSMSSNRLFGKASWLVSSPKAAPAFPEKYGSLKKAPPK